MDSCKLARRPRLLRTKKQSSTSRASAESEKGPGATRDLTVSQRNPSRSSKEHPFIDSPAMRPPHALRKPLLWTCRAPGRPSVGGGRSWRRRGRPITITGSAHPDTTSSTVGGKTQCPQLHTGRCVLVRAILHRSGLAANALCIKCELSRVHYRQKPDLGPLPTLDEVVSGPAQQIAEADFL